VLGPTDANAVAGAATKVAAPVVQPHHTRPAGLAGGSLRHPQHTEGPAKEVHTGGRSSALRTESCARTSRQGKAPRRNRRERSASPYRHRDSSQHACWACAGQGQGRRKPVQRTTRPLRRRLALRASGASKPTCDADCHVTLGRERPSGSICDSLAADGGGKYLPTYVQRVLAVS
jgi:hypothetical protein